MPLTIKQIEALKPQAKEHRVTDERGLSLIVHPNGGKYWRLKYRFDGKQMTLALGTYPDVSLARARERRDEARTLLADGIDPAQHRKATKVAQREARSNSFEAVAREWLADREHTISAKRHKDILSTFENDVFPSIGAVPVSQIEAPTVLSIMRRIDARGARYTAHRVRSNIGQVLNFAIATGRATFNPCPALAGAMAPAISKNMPALTDTSKVAGLLRAIDGYEGTKIVQCALRLAPLVFVRPGELRQAKWAEIDLDRGEWCYFVNKTKVDHLVPLSRQAVAILKEMREITGDGIYVFPSQRSKTRPMSDAAINAALRRMGYDTNEEMTGHGFRAMARTILHEELEIEPEVIEHQLAHKVAGSLGTAYNRTKFIKARIEMMQRWSDYLDKLKVGAEIIRIAAA